MHTNRSSHTNSVPADWGERVAVFLWFSAGRLVVEEASLVGSSLHSSTPLLTIQANIIYVSSKQFILKKTC